mmetsp:Transcript_11179/g.31242  ORF Transcript_11179/g.31242 Transcript_11179/m.31242 type:complete len:225 (+) Transcript_11179:1860-2534(+)
MALLDSRSADDPLVTRLHVGLEVSVGQDEVRHGGATAGQLDARTRLCVARLCMISATMCDAPRPPDRGGEGSHSLRSRRRDGPISPGCGHDRRDARWNVNIIGTNTDEEGIEVHIAPMRTTHVDPLHVDPLTSGGGRDRQTSSDHITIVLDLLLPQQRARIGFDAPKLARKGLFRDHASPDQLARWVVWIVLLVLIAFVLVPLDSAHHEMLIATERLRATLHDH